MQRINVGLICTMPRPVKPIEGYAILILATIVMTAIDGVFREIGLIPIYNSKLTNPGNGDGGIRIPKWTMRSASNLLDFHNPLDEEVEYADIPNGTFNPSGGTPVPVETTTTRSKYVYDGKLAFHCDDVLALCPQTPLRQRTSGIELSKPKEFPFLLSTHKYAGDEHICAAVILNEYWVLSAAHCLRSPDISGYEDVLDYSNTTVVAGTLSSSLWRPTYCEQRRTIRKAVFHKRYNTAPGAHDIALYKLKSPFVFNEYVMPIQLPPEQYEVLVGANCTVVGWSNYGPGPRTSECLMKLELNSVQQPNCTNVLPTRSQMGDGICLLPGKGKKTVCPGDPGGVLLCDGMLAGITSQANEAYGCGSASAGLRFLSIARYLDWIIEIVKNTA